MPGDFKNADFNELVKAFKTGKWTVDWLDMAGLDEPTEDTVDKALFIRPAVKGIKEIYDISKGGECIFLTANGCELDFKKRPTGCRLLEPVEAKPCIMHGATVKEAAMAWMPFNEVIENAVAFVNTDSND